MRVRIRDPESFRPWIRDSGLKLERDKSRIRNTANMASYFTILGATAGRSWNQKNPTPI
jgi:hypothetical protein